jgi:hypothetical protein
MTTMATNVPGSRRTNLSPAPVLQPDDGFELRRG